jgi:hypothetical protein
MVYPMASPSNKPAAPPSRRTPLVRVSFETHAEILRLAAADGASAAAIIGRLVEAERRRRIVDDFVRHARENPADLLGEAKDLEGAIDDGLTDESYPFADPA